MSYHAGKDTVAHFNKCREASALGSRLPDSDSSSSVVTYDTIMTAVERSLKVSPSSFNSQDTRIVALLGADHVGYWRLVCERLRSTCGEKASSRAAEAECDHIEKAVIPAMGTLLYLINDETVNATCAAYPAYAASFPGYAEQSAAMAASAAWTAISTLDSSLGAMPVYYGAPVVVDAKSTAAAKAKGLNPAFPAAMAIPAGWHLSTEFVFGSVEETPKPAAVIPTNHQVMVFSSDYVSAPRTDVGV